MRSALACCTVKTEAGSLFDLTKNIEYAGARQFMKVLCANTYQNRARFGKVMAKIKRCSFLLHVIHVIRGMMKQMSEH